LLKRDLDRKDLIAKLEAAAASNRKAAADSIRLDGVLDTDKYVVRLLEYGDVQAATLGLEKIMGVDQKWLYGQCSAGVEAMKEEVKNRKLIEVKRVEIENDRIEHKNLLAEGKHALAETKQKEIDEKTKETDELLEMMVMAEKIFLPICDEEAGSCDLTFQNGWKMDCDPDTGEVFTERLVDDGKGGKRGMSRVVWCGELA
jgi:hypothetical protein